MVGDSHREQVGEPERAWSPKSDLAEPAIDGFDALVYVAQCSIWVYRSAYRELSEEARAAHEIDIRGRAPEFPSSTPSGRLGKEAWDALVRAANKELHATPRGSALIDAAPDGGMLTEHSVVAWIFRGIVLDRPLTKGKAISSRRSAYPSNLRWPDDVVAYVRTVRIAPHIRATIRQRYNRVAGNANEGPEVRPGADVHEPMAHPGVGDDTIRPDQLREQPWVRSSLEKSSASQQDDIELCLAYVEGTSLEELTRRLLVHEGLQHESWSTLQLFRVVNSNKSRDQTPKRRAAEVFFASHPEKRGAGAKMNAAYENVRAKIHRAAKTLAAERTNFFSDE